MARFLSFIVLWFCCLLCSAGEITTSNLNQFFNAETGTYTIPAGDVVTLTADFSINPGEILDVYGELKLNYSGKPTLTNAGSVVVHDGAILSTFNFANGGTVNFEEHATLSISNNLTSNAGGVFTLAENQKISVKYMTYNGGVISGPESSLITVTEKMANNGTLTIDDGFKVNIVKVLENRGTININTDFRISGTVTNNSEKTIVVSLGSSLTLANTFTNNGTLKGEDGSYVTIKDLTNNGTITIGENAAVKVSDGATNNSSGTITVASGSSITCDHNLSNSGTVTLNKNANVTVSGTLTNNKTLKVEEGSNVSTKNLTNSGTISFYENTTVSVSGAVTNNSSGAITVSSGSSLTVASTVTNSGTLTLNKNASVAISGDVKNNSGGKITVLSDAIFTVADKKILTNYENGTITINGGTLETYNLCNMGDISVVSNTNLAYLHVKSQFYNISNESSDRHDKNYSGPQGRLYLSNSVFQVDEKLWVGEDQTHLVDRGIIVDGDGDTYILVNDMVHTSVGKNWLTVKNNSELYLITSVSNSYAGIDPGTAATKYNDDNKVWEFVDRNGKKDEVFVEGDYTYYKITDGKNVTGMSNGNHPNLYLKVPNNIHISGGIHKGGYEDMYTPENDKTISVINKEYNEIWRNTISSLLPVELESFEVVQSNTNIDFVWSTASEENTQLFEVQYSFDGVHFNTIANVDAYGTTSERHIYSTSVSSEKFPVDLVYFRLKMVDNDASYQYSNVVSVVLDSNAETLTVYPNPASEYITISGNFKSAVVVDRSGRNVAVQPMSANMLNIAGLSVGTYYVVVTTDNGKTVLPFVKE
ncbi:MAG: T9SS type A sorting domain-containing protein [Bacteroidales bacterium]|nr:T9SS type A sorting domain-containing protein [Bacteroidales bacterium]